MNLTTIPLLIVALLMMATSDPPVDSVELIMSGERIVVDGTDAILVGEAQVEIPAGVVTAGPVYQIGGELVVAGEVSGDLIQLAGTLVVEDGAVVGGELRRVGGSQEVAGSATVGRRTSVELVPAQRGGVLGYLPPAIFTALLALVAARLARTRPRAVGNVADAIVEHPVIVVTVGTLLTLTAIAVVVFMGFTLVLIPVAAVALVVGGLTVGYGFIAVGQVIGRRFPSLSPGRSAALGVVAGVVFVELLGLIPWVGDLAVLGILMAGVGAAVVTYYGVSHFEPVRVPQD